MSQSFTKKGIGEVLVLLVGALIAAAGKQQDVPLLLGLGVIIIGGGVILGGIGAIRRRRLIFLHGEARFTTHRFTGMAAVLWGILLLLTGLGLMAGGLAVAIGQQASLRQLVTQPAVWLLAGGIALFLVSAASMVQRATDGEHNGLRILLALPGYTFGALGVLLAIAMAGAGGWGLQDPGALDMLGAQLQTKVQIWLKTL
jgi:hypothetical protein